MLNKLPIEALIPGGELYNQFQPRQPRQVQADNGCLFCTLDDRLVLFDACAHAEMASVAMTDLGKLADLELKITETWHKVKRLPQVWVHHSATNEILLFSLAQPALVARIALKEGDENLDYSAEAGLWALTSGNALYTVDVNGTRTLVAQSDNKDIEAGQAAARVEFGINKGTFWGNKGTLLAYYLIDQSGVEEYPITHFDGLSSTTKFIKYPKTGGVSEKADLMIYDVRQGGAVRLQKQGNPEDYLCCVTFSPADDKIYAAELNRSQQVAHINRYDAHTGAFEATLFTEKDDKYTEPQHDFFFIPDTDWFVWQSRRDGFNHLYLYDLQGNLVRQLTRGSWEVTALVAYDADTKTILAECNQSNPIDRDLIQVTLDGQCATISNVPGTHTLVWCGKGAYLDMCSSQFVPFTALWRSTTNPYAIMPLCMSTDPLAGYAKPLVEFGRIALDDGSFFCYRLVYPADFDASKKYPMVCYFYGGPHVQLVRDDWNCGTAGFEYMMAQEGYIVFTVDPHGSDNRGRDFEQAVWRNISKVQVQDYADSVQYVCAQRPYIDTERIGVYGWSFGGHIATSLMLKCPDIFKVGVAGGPVINWRLYEVMYTERYMQTPEQNSEGYEDTDLTRFVAGLKGKLMLIHCNEDPVVLWQNSLSMLKAAEKTDVLLDYFVCVGYPHNVRGKNRVQLMKKVKSYFDQNL